jgi:hypothetical protein
MNRVGRWAPVVLLCVWALLAGCADQARPPAVTNQDAIVGQEVVTAQFMPVTVAGALAQQQAVQKARGFTSGANVGAVTASLVALTVRDTHGQIAWNLQARPVWLVLFSGVSYQPTTAADAGCACSQYDNRPNTAVALDPASGAMVLTYGYAGE